MKQETTCISLGEVQLQLDYCDQIRERLGQGPGTHLARVDTYGCQQNEADSERLRGFLARMGYGFAKEEEEADVIILNTCAIRENAEQRVFGNVGALIHGKRRKAGQIIAVCGCMAQEPHVVERIRKSFQHVDLVFGTHMLWKFPQLLLSVMQSGSRLFEADDQPGSIAEGLPVVRQNDLKAWVSIMYGCNNFCTYCVVPYTRGRERSRRAEDVIAEVRHLVEEGYRDITLLGQNVNSYGKDLENGLDFAGLLEELSSIPGDFLLRFMTSHPKDAGERLFDVMARSPNIAPHLHLPFQSGSTRVLRAMNRGYTREHYLSLVASLREKIPQIVLTSDVIVGFPGETEEEFLETLSLIEEVRFDALFTFVFSPREGTPAAKLPDPVSREEKMKWFQTLLDKQNEISAEKHRAYVGKTVRCLIDGEDGKGRLSGRTEGGRLVHLDGSPALIGQYLPVHITASTTWSLVGTLEEEGA